MKGLPKTKYWELNEKIERLIREKDSMGLSYSQEEIRFIQQYSGAGGKGKSGATGQGVLYEFYTPTWLCKSMWALAKHHGFSGGNVLEPSCASGALFADAPIGTKLVGFEINPITHRIAELSYPQARVHKGYFETAFLKPPRFRERLKGSQTWLDEYPFDLAIGNPPFGKYTNLFSSYFPKPQLPTFESFFIYYGLKLLKPGGLLVYVISSNFLRNGGSYEKAKEEIEKVGTLIDAYRLPPVFQSSEVPVDVVVLKRMKEE